MGISSQVSLGNTRFFPTLFGSFSAAFFPPRYFLGTAVFTPAGEKMACNIHAYRNHLFGAQQLTRKFEMLILRMRCYFLE